MSQVKVLGADYCGFCTKVKKYLDGKGVNYEWVDTESANGAKERA